MHGVNGPFIQDRCSQQSFKASYPVQIHAKELMAELLENTDKGLQKGIDTDLNSTKYAARVDVDN